jgi:hypothetical protein
MAFYFSPFIILYVSICCFHQKTSSISLLSEKYTEKHRNIYIYEDKGKNLIDKDNMLREKKMQDNKIDSSIIIPHNKIFNHRQLCITTGMRMCYRHR